MAADPKALVAAGYDQIAETYLDQFARSTVRTSKCRELVRDLPPSSRVLDLGCGAGIPVARELASEGFDVTGVDLSARQIALARSNVPEAHFVEADMIAVEFPPKSFDAIGAFYSITHLPRDEHGALLRRISMWLKPGGRFVGSFGVRTGDWQGPWLGTTMFFSHNDAAETERLMAAADLRIERAETLAQDNEDASFFWITARKA